MNLSQTINKETTEVTVPGFIKKLSITYGYWFETQNNPTLVWNVAGTNHCFNIDLRTVISHHNTNYNEHFILTLIKLHEDIQDWLKTQDENHWAAKYYTDFGKLLKL